MKMKIKTNNAIQCQKGFDETDKLLLGIQISRNFLEGNLAVHQYIESFKKNSYPNDEYPKGAVVKENQEIKVGEINCKWPISMLRKCSTSLAMRNEIYNRVISTNGRFLN